MSLDTEDTELDLRDSEKENETTSPKPSIEDSYSLCGASLTNTGTISETLISELCTLKLEKKGLERYAYEAGNERFMSKDSSNSSTGIIEYVNSELETETIDLRERAISETFDNIKESLQVDLCFVIDCTGSMSSYIAATKDCIQKVIDHMESTNPNIKLWVGLCGYRDHCDGSDRLQIFDFTNSYSEFKNYLSFEVRATGGGDEPEDVLGGLDAAVNKMGWRHRTRIILHMGDCPPHGRRFTTKTDDYPDGEPHGLTAEGVLENIRSEEIFYNFVQITDKTDKMLDVFREIIGDFLVIKLDTDGKEPDTLTTKIFEAVCSSITSSVTVTSLSKESVYKERLKNLEIDTNEPDWDKLPIKTGKLLHFRIPKTLDDIKNPKYFKGKSNIVLRKISYKHAPKPFSKGAERFAYLALDCTRESAEEIVIKECKDFGRKANSLERHLETVEVSTIAHFLSKEFNTAAKRANVTKKVNFLKSQALRHKDDNNQWYTVESKFNGTFKRFNVNRGVIKEYHSTLEAFAHFTYDYTDGYLVVYDLQGVELNNQFKLTDPAIHCTDRLRFGRTNLGNRGIKECFLANHKCNNVCKKLDLTKLDSAL